MPCHVPHPLPHLLRAPLDAAVLAGHVLAVPVVSSSTRQTQVGVALPNGQVAGALLGVALCFAAAARKAVLTCRDSHRRGLMEPSQQPPYPAAQMRRNFLVSELRGPLPSIMSITTLMTSSFILKTEPPQL